MSRYIDVRNTQVTPQGFNAETEKIANTQQDHLSRKPVDGPNQMETTLDMNSERIINLPEPESDHEPLTLGRGKSILDEATAQATKAEEEANRAEQEANAAAQSAQSASESEIAAEESASRVDLGALDQAVLDSEQAALAAQDSANQSSSFADESQGFSIAAHSSATLAETAAEQAAATGLVYESSAAGQADGELIDGDYFWVVSADSDEVLELWQKGASSPTDTGKRTISSDAVLKPNWAGNRIGYPDTFFERVEHREDLFGRSYLESVAGNFSMWEFRENSAFKGRELYSDTSQPSGSSLFAGPAIYPDEIGATEGDTITIAVVLSGTSNNTRLYSRDYSSRGNPIGSSGQTSIGSLTPEPKVYYRTVTISSGTQFIIATPVVWDSGDLTLHACWFFKGQPEDGPSWPVFDDRLTQFLAVKGSEALGIAEEALEKAEEEASAEPNIDYVQSYGAFNLQSYNAKLADTETRLNVCVLGSSSVNTRYRFVSPLIGYLAGKIGNHSVGYISANTSAQNPINASRTVTGDWTHTIGDGPDAYQSNSTDVGATIQFHTSAFTIDKSVIHYLQQPGGGEFSYTVSGESPVTVDTDGPLEYMTLDVGGPSPIDVTVVTAGSEGVTLFGCELIDTTADGVIMHKLGNSGAGASRFLNIEESYFTKALESFDPDVFFIHLGINDFSAQTAPETYKQRLTDLVSRVRGVNPLCDIVFVAQGPANLPRSIAIDQYSKQMLDLAVENDFTFFDLNKIFGSWEKADALGTYEDNVHPSAQGGRVVLRELVNNLIKIN